MGFDDTDDEADSTHMKRSWLILVVVPPLAGCFSPEKPSLVSNDPSLKIPAIKQSAAARDGSAIKQLVKDLDSDDPAVRFYAIRALREITGNTFDYRYYEDEIQRKPALKRWQVWLATRQGKSPATTQSS
jgi:hypothetical protein